MGYFDRGVAVAQICCDAWHVGDIVQGEIRHELVHLQKQRQGLTDATRRAQDGDLSVLLQCRNGKGRATYFSALNGQGRSRTRMLRLKGCGLRSQTMRSGEEGSGDHTRASGGRFACLARRGSGE